ncbi:MAG: acyclic terpene utilization AtuA family protein [Pirellulaceae bacterium]
MSEIVRIGNAQAFWGDRGEAAAEILAREPDLDYLTLDYLAELSMSILAMQRERDPNAGFARDFVQVVRSLVPYWSAGGRCRLIANAGGLNPRACAEACRVALEETGCRSLSIGVVTGDDVLEIMRTAATDASSPEFRNLDTATSLHEVADRLVTASAYLGASPIVEALAAGADIVITGRVADPSLVVAACVHHFGWSEDDLSRIAGATVAGHLIECGTQVTGGISTDWLDVPDPAHIGYPIVEVARDGSCVVTKPPGTGGCVTELTVKEQLVYEIGDPGNYLSPDVTVSFLSLQVTDLGGDRVQVTGALGKPCPDSYKVSATFRDGFRAAGTLTIVGRHAVDKARRVGDLILQRVREGGHELRDSVIECLGTGACAMGSFASITGDDQQDESHDFLETVMRVAVEADSRDAVEQFTRELMPFITAGPPGTTGYAEGRPRVHPVFRYWPCLIPRDGVNWQVETMQTKADAAITESAGPRRIDLSVAEKSRTPIASAASRGTEPTTLYDIACARSGDKGLNANIGVIARDPSDWEFLSGWLTADRVAAFLSPLGFDSIERFELPNLTALNFLLHGVLRHSLRTDAQGKALGQILLEMPLPANAMRTIPKP